MPFPQSEGLEPPQPISVSDVIAPSASALGSHPDQLEYFLSEVAEFVRPQLGGESDPSRDTIVSYAASRAKDTKCSAKFASIILDFLHSRRDRITNMEQREQLRRAREKCYAVLNQYQSSRYETSYRSDAGSLSRIPQVAGAYVLFRRGTSSLAMQQELLVLAHRRPISGKGKDGGTYATYVNPELVCRGTWCVVDHTVCCMMQGFRGTRPRREIINQHLLYEDHEVPHAELVSGFQVGISSLHIVPTAVPIVAVKVPKQCLSKDIMRVGNFADSEIRAAWAEAAYGVSRDVEDLGTILDDAMTPANGILSMRTSEITSKILRRYPNPNSIISDALISFCNGFTPDQGWRLGESKP